MGTPRSEVVAIETEREDQAAVWIEKPFAVGRYAITFGEFKTFVTSSGHEMAGGCYDAAVKLDPSHDWRSPGFVQTDAHPVVCVNFEDATAYARWLSERTGKPYRLLSEAEREYVARAGTTTPFWWGANISTDRANYDGRVTYEGGRGGEFRKGTVPVDSFEANPWGLFNVHGNVWEWTSDCWNDGNAGNPGDGSARASGDCTLRVLRGAGWGNHPHTLRSAKRSRGAPLARQRNVGFRVARSLDAD
jgi:formylglycine-generating enzyme required for sulfatase activity